MARNFIKIASLRRLLNIWIFLFPTIIYSAAAVAVPSFARQTGMTCSACHTVFPELTAFGRQFKLRGYTLESQSGNQEFPYNLPLTVGLQSGITSISDPNKGATQSTDFPRADKAILQQVAFYYAGKISDNMGAWVQYNWDGIAKSWGAEMADIRYADSLSAGSKDLLFGVSLANSPTVQDVWSTTPMWAFPHLNDAGIMPMYRSLLDMTLDNQVGAVSLYAQYDSQYYGEIGMLEMAVQEYSIR